VSGEVVATGASCAAGAAVVLTGARWVRRRPPRRPPHAYIRAASRDRPRRRRRWMALRVMGLVGLALLLPPLAVLPVLLNRPVRLLRARRRATHRRTEIARSLPDAVELLLVAVRAGLTPPLALRAVAPHVPAPVGPTLALVVDRLDRGQRLDAALDVLPDELGTPARHLTSALRATDRYGVPLAVALERAAHELRAERRRAAEAAARRLPVRLAFPLVGCILPAFALLTLAPLLAGALHGLHL
jgi:Flp pilus assembly protein TadB